MAAGTAIGTIEMSALKRAMPVGGQPPPGVVLLTGLCWIISIHRKGKDQKDHHSS